MTIVPGAVARSSARRASARRLRLRSTVLGYWRRSWSLYEQIAELHSRAMQSASYGSNRDIQDFGDVLVLLPFQLLQHQHHAMLGRQPMQRIHQLSIFLA